MTGSAPRVAFFPDTYFEIDGVANTSRQFEAFAIRHELPFLTVCGGEWNRSEEEGTVTRITLHRGPLGFGLDKKHTFDLAFWRHYHRVEALVRDFNPHVVHITGPSDVGQLGALIAHKLRVPLAASWHTNLHQYAEQRGNAVLWWLPRAAREKVGRALRQLSLRALHRFYKIPRMLFAPNQDLIDVLTNRTGKPCYPMSRGVDTRLFDPRRRERLDKTFVLGYVGRLTTEKNTRFLADLENALRHAGMTDLCFLIVGQGAEETWLKAQMRHAEFTGVLHGEDLARAYAKMDVFVFPSRTDTYGNVVLEALASGVPAIVTNTGGPRFIVRSGETGFVAKDLAEFVLHIQTLASEPARLAKMRTAAREFAVTASWNSVFESVYARYAELMSCDGEKSVRRSTRAVATAAANSRQTIL